MHLQPFAGSSVLVTGGAGFVGGNLVQWLLEGDVAAVHVVDNLLSGERTNVPDDHRVLFTEDSIAADHVVQNLRDDYDFVFHLSTYHGNQSSIHDPLADHEHNQLTTLKLFDWMKSFRRIRKVVYAGAGCALADKTFDQAHATLEDAPISLHMDSPYSISKIVGEFYAVYYHARHGLPTVRARFQNIYGPGEILGAGQWRGTPATVWRNVVPTFVYKALKGLPLQLDNEGRATRDFIYVDDIVRGLLLCASDGAPGDVYNLASGTETSILQLATMINELTGNVMPVQVMPRRDWDRSGKRFGSTDKARQELGFESHVPLRDGLTWTIAWTREQMPRIESCIDRHSAQMSIASGR